MSKKYYVTYEVGVPPKLGEEQNRYVPNDNPEFHDIDDAIEYLESQRHIRHLAISITNWHEVTNNE